jgi:hypothetical protein
MSVRLLVWEGVQVRAVPEKPGKRSVASRQVPPRRRLPAGNHRTLPGLPDNNRLLDVSIIRGTTTAKVLTDSSELKTALRAEGIDFRAGETLFKPTDIESVLAAVRIFHNGSCRFDYQLTYATPVDYYLGRERFEKYFYPAGLQKTQ